MESFEHGDESDFWKPKPARKPIEMVKGLLKKVGDRMAKSGEMHFKQTRLNQ